MAKRNVSRTYTYIVPKLNAFSQYVNSLATFRTVYDNALDYYFYTSFLFSVILQIAWAIRISSVCSINKVCNAVRVPHTRIHRIVTSGSAFVLLSFAVMYDVTRFGGNARGPRWIGLQMAFFSTRRHDRAHQRGLNCCPPVIEGC